MRFPRPSNPIVISAATLLVAALFSSGDQRAEQSSHRESLVGNPKSSTATLASANSPTPRTSISDRASTNRPPLVFVQAPVVAKGDVRTRFPRGSRLVRLEAQSPRESPLNLTPGFFAVADPQISFDGAKVLFTALTKRGARWQIWEMNVDGSSKRQVTKCDADCLRAAYLPREHFAYTAVEGNGGRLKSDIHVALLDGSEDHQITFGPGNYQVETVLRDGRILVSAASPLVARGAKSSTLYALRHDGTSLQSLRCEHKQPAHRADAVELADGSVVFVKTLGERVGGELATIRRAALHNSVLNPPAASWSPRPLGEGKLIVARKDAGTRSTARFDLYAVDSSTGRVDELIYKDTKLSSVQAVPVAAHAVPRWYWSTIKPDAKSGYFICLDAYHSADEPSGRITTPVKQVRVLTLDSAKGKERSLGEAPVEADGSFYVAVPPDQPMRFELLDEQGSVIRAQESWIWARPGEERGCVGCHEDKSVAPENRWPMTLRRFDTPTPMGTEVDVKVEH